MPPKAGSAMLDKRRSTFVFSPSAAVNRPARFVARQAHSIPGRHTNRKLEQRAEASNGVVGDHASSANDDAVDQDVARLKGGRHPVLDRGSKSYKIDLAAGAGLATAAKRQTPLESPASNLPTRPGSHQLPDRQALQGPGNLSEEFVTDATAPMPLVRKMPNAIQNHLTGGVLGANAAATLGQTSSRTTSSPRVSRVASQRESLAPQRKEHRALAEVRDGPSELFEELCRAVRDM